MRRRSQDDESWSLALGGHGTVSPLAPHRTAQIGIEVLLIPTISNTGKEVGKHKIKLTTAHGFLDVSVVFPLTGFVVFLVFLRFPTNC